MVLLTGGDCQAGGMACDKECGLVEADGGQSNEATSNCRTVMEEMCGDVAKQVNEIFFSYSTCT